MRLSREVSKIVGRSFRQRQAPNRRRPSFVDVIEDMNETNASTSGFVVAFRNSGTDGALPLQRNGTGVMHLVAQQHECTTQQR
eukprot:1713984-Heterocapsa_arctica.AAC.1